MEIGVTLSCWRTGTPMLYWRFGSKLISHVAFWSIPPYFLVYIDLEKVRFNRCGWISVEGWSYFDQIYSEIPIILLWHICGLHTVIRRKLLQILLTLIILNSNLAKIEHWNLVVIITAVLEIDHALVMNILLRLLQGETVRLCARVRLICQVACILRTGCSRISFSDCCRLHHQVGISEGRGLLSLILCCMKIMEWLSFTNTFKHLLGGYGRRAPLRWLNHKINSHVRLISGLCSHGSKVSSFPLTYFFIIRARTHLLFELHVFNDRWKLHGNSQGELISHNLHWLVCLMLILCWRLNGNALLWLSQSRLAIIFMWFLEARERCLSLMSLNKDPLMDIVFMSATVCIWLGSGWVITGGVMLILFNTYLYILFSLIGGFIIDVGHRILADLTLRSNKWSLNKRRRLLSF